MLDSITLTRVPGTPPTPDSWTVALVSGAKNATVTIINVSNTTVLAGVLLKTMLVMDLAINLGGSIDASKI